MSPPAEQRAVNVDQVRLNQQSQISLRSQPDGRSGNASEIQNPLTMNQSVEQAAEQMPAAAAPEQTQNDK